MGLLILIVMGATLGWLVANVLQVETRDGILGNVGSGMVGAMLAGTVANSGSVLQGLSAIALLMAMIGALAFIALANAVRVKA